MKNRYYSYILTALISSSVASAATGTWSGSTSGTWNTSSTNWTGVTGSAWDATNGPTNTATFNLASLAATISGTVTTNGITATLGGSLTGGTLNLAGTTPTISVASGQTLQIGTSTTDTAITGSNGLVKDGAGILAIGGTSKAITGGIQVNNGTLRFTTGGGLGSNTITLGASGGGNVTLDFSNNGLNTSNNVITINSTGGTKTLSVTSGVTASIASINVNGNYSKTGLGTLIISGAGSRTSGNLTISAGTIQANSAAALPGYNVVGGVVVNGSSSQLNLRVSGSGWTATEVNSVISNMTKTSGALGIDTTNGSFTQTAAWDLGVLGLTKNGTNTLILDRANTFSGPVTINAGTLRVTHSDALGTGTKNIDMQGGSRVFELSNGVTLASSFTLRMSSNSFDNGGISSIDGVNAIQGNIQITSGNPALNISSSGTSRLTISGNITNVTDSRPLLFGGNSTQENTVSGIIGENTADRFMPVTKQGTGTWVFSNANTYKGATNIHNGTLSINTIADYGTASSIGTGVGATEPTNPSITIGNAGTTGTMLYTGSGNSSNRTIQIGNNTGTPAAGDTGGSAIVNNGTGALNFTASTFNTAQTGVIASAARMLTLGGSNTGDNTIAGIIQNNITGVSGTGNVAVTKSGAGKWILSGANTYSGGTTVAEGTLMLRGGNDRLLNTSAVVLGGAGTSGKLVLGDSGSASNQTLTGLTTAGLGGSVVGAHASNNSVLTLNIASGTNTFGGTLGGAGTNENRLALTKQGAGKLTLTGSNTYTGATTVSAGSLVVNGSLASTSVVVESTGSLGGSGVLGSAVLSGSGSINPGNSPGVLTASSVDVAGGLDFNFEFNVANGMPTWNAPTASGNDVLRLTGGTPFSGTMNTSNVINIFLNVGSLTVGDTFTGGFYTDVNADFMSVLSGATVNYFLADLGGLTTYEGNTFTSYTGPLTFGMSTIQQTADFGSGNITGRSLQFTVVPETSVSLLGGLSAMLLLRRRRSA